ncbi:hypothetical protein K438DRAFT_1773923 [Mycena galopus ATCC 62051]|nr:hypothetical protein K438DRAFT_1773923 [Mycena galopus ATCC 62051]
MQDIPQCVNKVEGIRVSTLRIIEAERQREFAARIEESREIADGVPSLTRRTSARSRVFGSITRSISYDYMRAMIGNYIRSCDYVLNPPRLLQVAFSEDMFYHDCGFAQSGAKKMSSADMPQIISIFNTAGFQHSLLYFGRQQCSPAKYLERGMNRNLLQQAARYTHQLRMDPRIVLLRVFQCALQCSRHRFDGAVHLVQLVGETVPIDVMNDQCGQAETQKNITVVGDEGQCPSRQEVDNGSHIYRDFESRARSGSSMESNWSQATSSWWWYRFVSFVFLLIRVRKSQNRHDQDPFSGTTEQNHHQSCSRMEKHGVAWKEDCA